MPETELDKVLKAEEEKDTPPAVEPEREEPVKTEEELKREEHLANLKKATEEAEGELQKIRKATKAAKANPLPEEEDDLPDITQTIEQDPTAKAFDRRQDRKIQPLKDEMEQAKSEVRGFALRQFLASNPALARNAAKVKEMMQYYEKAHTCTERTAEGVLLDLRRAAGAVFSEELLDMAKGRRNLEAQADEMFSAPAIDNGATGYRAQRDTAKVALSREQKDMLQKWGMTEQEWQEDNKKYVPK
jgi:hypothetical protein